MNPNWNFFPDENEGSNPPMTSLLPSSLKDVWDDEDPMQGIPVSHNPRQHVAFPNSGSIGRRAPGFPLAESAPSMAYIDDTHDDMTFMGEIEPDGGPTQVQYYQVQFHPNRTVLFRAPMNLQLTPGTYVLTEADRGFDVGRIVSQVQKPTQREVKAAKSIVRLASQHEIAQLPQKAEREARAREQCQKKAQDFGLPMIITGAEFQFDGKKLIFYYSATSYVDFRILVRALFKVYGTRIWMVWHDGNAPVKDVFARSDQNDPALFQ